VFPLGHVGIGTHLIPRPWRDRLPWRWLAFGCLLPDVVDKPVWLVAQWSGAQSPLFETARLFGHTAFFLAAVVVAALWRRSPWLLALAYGVPTHFFLDVLTDAGMGGGFGVWKSWIAWPWELPRLRTLLSVSPVEELGTELTSKVYLAGECIGAGLLLWDWVRAQRSAGD
jgi:membrane-bound metal-dependent hydrolase YbcI (DUF457 family)